MPTRTRITNEITATLNEAATPADALTMLRLYIEVSTELLPVFVERARAFGYTWPVIGDALDITPQGAQQRFSQQD